MERYWHVGGQTPWRGAEVFPRAPGPFIRRAVDAAEPQRDLVIGQWGLVPWFAKTSKLTYSTNNATGEIGRPRRNHSAIFKAKLAVDAIKADKTLAELAKAYDVHPNQIVDYLVTVGKL